MLKGSSDPYSGTIRAGKKDPWNRSHTDTQIEVDIAEGKIAFISCKYLGDSVGNSDLGDHQWYIKYDIEDWLYMKDLSKRNDQAGPSFHYRQRDFFKDRFVPVSGILRKQIQALVDAGLMHKDQVARFDRYARQIKSGEFERLKKREPYRPPVRDNVITRPSVSKSSLSANGKSRRAKLNGYGIRTRVSRFKRNFLLARSDPFR